MSLSLSLSNLPTELLSVILLYIGNVNKLVSIKNHSINAIIRNLFEHFVLTNNPYIIIMLDLSTYKFDKHNYMNILNNLYLRNIIKKNDILKICYSHIEKKLSSWDSYLMQRLQRELCLAIFLEKEGYRNCRQYKAILCVSSNYRMNDVLCEVDIIINGMIVRSKKLGHMQTNDINSMNDNYYGYYPVVNFIERQKYRHLFACLEMNQIFERRNPFREDLDCFNSSIQKKKNDSRELEFMKLKNDILYKLNEISNIPCMQDCIECIELKNIISCEINNIKKIPFFMLFLKIFFILCNFFK